MTQRLYYTDSYLREFDARVLERGGDGRVIYLDQTAFYPVSGGQPHDTGTIAGVPVLEVQDEGERIAHRTAAPVEDDEVACCIDWPRRFDHMQQHSGQHLLSAVFTERFGLATVSFHLGQESSTIDLATPALDPATVLAAEQRANEAVFEDRPLTVSFEDAPRDLRKPSERAGTLRIISIEGLDRSACGGTHVRRTGEIGPILIRKLDKIRNTVRVEFLCGARAVRRARADFDALSRERAAQLETAKAADKLRRKLEAQLAEYQGRELYAATAPDATGVRRIIRRLPSGNLEELRALAQSFTALPSAVFVALLDEPPSILVAASEDAGVDAGQRLKSALAHAGGRGGGTARMAQGSVPNPQALDAVLTWIFQTETPNRSTT